MRTVYRSFASVLSTLIATAAFAADEITVQKSAVGCQANRWTSIGTFDSGEAISISGIDNSWTAIRVRSTSTLAEIGTITLTGSRTSGDPLEILVAGLDCLPIDASAPVFAEAGTTCPA